MRFLRAIDFHGLPRARGTLLVGLAVGAFLTGRPVQAASTNDYTVVDAIFSAHCLDCHAAKDPESGLVLESFQTLMKGGEIGLDVLPGNSADSLLVKMVEGRFQKDGKMRIMPPGKRQKLSAAEIVSIKEWIDAGAAAPAGAVAPRELIVPRITPRVSPRNPVNALCASPDLNSVAAARYGQVELRDASRLELIRTFAGPAGNVNALVFTANGAQLFAAGGQPGVSGEVRHWNVSDGLLIRAIEGHRDAIYAMALSPDGKLLATGSYDQKIKLWGVEDGKEIRTLSGHNGCVHALSFRRDGKILASASADRTVKLWDVASGERRETLSQSLKELYALAFSPDGKRLLAAGADNRIRIWEVSETAAETTNPILDSKFAHEGTILNLVFSPDGKALLSSGDDRTVKLWDWDSAGIKERLSFERQPDWGSALTFLSGHKAAVGRMDGSLAAYDLQSGNRVAEWRKNSPQRPALSRRRERERSSGF
jgi:hypothetical protein